MTYLITGINIIALVVLSQCNVKDNGTLTHGSYVYINNANTDISMTIIDRRKKNTETVSISKNDSVTFTMIGEGVNPFKSEFYDSITGDSIIIKKGNKCLHHYTKSDQFGNGVFTLNNYENYSSDLVSQSNFILYYIFDDEEFDTALDCE